MLLLWSMKEILPCVSIGSVDPFLEEKPSKIPKLEWISWEAAIIENSRAPWATARDLPAASLIPWDSSGPRRWEVALLNPDTTLEDFHASFSSASVMLVAALETEFNPRRATSTSYPCRHLAMMIFKLSLVIRAVKILEQLALVDLN